MKLRALIIDDSRIMRNMVKEALRRTELAQFEFIDAENGEDAMQKFDPNKIDIVFVDWNMPKMTGIDFIRKVRLNKQATHIPLVMVTSEKTITKVDFALEKAGADAFISKPFTVKELKFKLSKIIEKIGNKQEVGSDQSSGYFGKLVGG